MAQTLRPEFHSNLANQIVKDIQLLKSNFYYFLGKVSVWNETDTPPSTVTLSLQEETQARESILYMGKITPNDASLCALRHNWESGTVYQRWNDKIPMQGLSFYVLTSEFRVYKCLDNNGGAASIIEPLTSDGLDAFRAADGYVWKYMYSIPSFKQFKFLNQNYIPVQVAISDSFYNKGSISDVSIASGGSGYVNGTTTISVSGDGSGASFTPVIYNGSIVDVVNNNPGKGYSYAVLTITGDGVGATLNAIIGLADIVSDQSIVEQTTVPGAIYAVNVTNAGSGYNPLLTPKITITGDGSDATAVAIMNAGTLVRVVMTNFGKGYSYANMIVEPPIGVGSVGATVEPIYGPYKGHGYNAVNELYADTFCVSTVLNANPTLASINQDFRQYGIIKNPHNTVTDTFSTTSESLIAFRVNMISTSGLQNDMELTSAYGYRYVVVKFDSTSVYLQPQSNTTTAPLGTLSNSVGTTFFVNTVISSPTINKYTGELMSVSSEAAFSFTTQQSVALKTFIKC